MMFTEHYGQFAFLVTTLLTIVVLFISIVIELTEDDKDV